MSHLSDGSFPFGGAQDIQDAIRPVRESDMSFVRETTCKARWPRVPVNPAAPFAEWRYTRPLTWHEWEAAHGPTVDQWIADGMCNVLDAGDDTILGFVIATTGDGLGSLIRMVYVKREFRGHGFGRELLYSVGAVPPYRAHLPTASWEMWERRTRRAA